MVNSFFQILFFYIFIFLIQSKEYHVDGKTFSTIGEVIAIHQPGDTIFVHSKENKEPYREKFVLCFDNVTLLGIADSEGNKPIIDGKDAVTHSGFSYMKDYSSLIKVGQAYTPKARENCPIGIKIEGFELRNAYPGNSYQTGDGTTKTYGNFISAIYIECGRSLTVRNNDIHNNGLGFTSAIQPNWYEKTWELHNKDFLIEYNKIYQNGVVDSVFEHNVYSEAEGITVQFNYFGDVVDGAKGHSFKDRSSGLIFRYNYVNGGANRQLDLSDIPFEGEVWDELRSKDDYHQSFIYGNIFVERNTNLVNYNMFQFGGDQSNTSNYRMGPVFFYYNTIVSKRTDRSSYLLQLMYGYPATGIFENNLMYHVYEDPTYHNREFGLLFFSGGSLHLRNNGIKDGYHDGCSGTGCEVSNINAFTISDKERVFEDLEGNNYFLFQNHSSIIKGNANLNFLNESIQNKNLLPKYQFKKGFSHTELKFTERNSFEDFGALSFDQIEDEQKIIDPGVIIATIIISMLIVAVFISVFFCIMLTIFIISFSAKKKIVEKDTELN